RGYGNAAASPQAAAQSETQPAGAGRTGAGAWPAAAGGCGIPDRPGGQRGLRQRGRDASVYPAGLCVTYADSQRPDNRGRGGAVRGAAVAAAGVRGAAAAFWVAEGVRDRDGRRAPLCGIWGTASAARGRPSVMVAYTFSGPVRDHDGR